MAELNDDWLDTAEPAPTTRDLVLKDPEFKAMAEHTKKLTAQQRNFVACFAASHYDPVLACRKYKEQFGREMSPRRLAKWMQDEPEFLTAITMRESIAARASGVSVANTLDCLADIRRRTLGVDDRACMQALELIGKHLKMFRVAEETTQRREGPGLVVVQIKGDAEITVNPDTDSATIRTVN